MNSLAQLLVAGTDLLEAEGRALRAGTVRVGIALGTLILGMVLALAGLGFLIWGVYELFKDRGMSTSVAALITGALILAIAGALVWLAKTMTQTHSTDSPSASH